MSPVPAFSSPNACPECLEWTLADGVDCPSCGRELDGSATPEPHDEVLAAALEEFERRRAAEPGLDPREFSAAYPEVSERLCGILELLVQLDAAGVAGERHGILPERFGRYVVREELGRGGAARVFRAHDPELDRHVALKVLYLDPLQVAQCRARFLREARALAQLNHEHVVPVLDMGTQDSWCWIAMELMSGSLSDELAGSFEPSRGPADACGVVGRVVAAAEGLAHAHSRGVLHRDVKPSNLLVDEHGQVRVGDFGLAWVDGEASLTRTGAALGTPGFSAPEQLLGNAADERSDIHALGATLHALLTGRPPGRGASSRAVDESLPAGLRAIVERAVALDPADRHPTVKALADDLRDWLGGARRSPRRQRRFLWGGLFVLAVGLVVSSVVWWMTGDEDVASGYVIALGERRADGLAPGIVWSLVRGDPGLPAETRDLELPAPWHGYRASIRATGRRAEVSLLRGGESLARAWLDPPSRVQEGESWSFRHPPRDVDRDGLPELILQHSGNVAVLKWEPNAWGDPSVGWRVRLNARFGTGSPMLADWDGDGADELLVASCGSVSSGIHGALHALNPLNGEVEATVPLGSTIESTPQFSRDRSGRVLSTYLAASDMPVSGGRPARLWRIVPSAPLAPTFRDFAGVSALTWPVFQDVDRDGVDEVLVGTVEVREGTERSRIFCLRDDLQGQPLWTLEAPAEQMSYMLLSDQDRDGMADACFCVMGECLATRTQSDLAAAQRVIWRVGLRPGERVAHQPIELDDMNGDGIPEVAAGTTDARIVVLSARSSEPIASFDMPVSRQFGGGILARLTTLSDEEGRQLIVAATADGWLVAHSLSRAEPEPAWSVRLGVRGSVASPVPVRLPAPDHGAGVLSAAHEPSLGQSRLLVVGADGMHPIWGYATAAWVQGTPVTCVRSGRQWAYFADADGHVHGIPLDPS